MATGDQSDMLSRLRALLPPTWFADSSPILTGMLAGMAEALAWAYSLYQFAKAQTRIATASGGWLDMVSLDFFGTGLPRTSNQTDASYRARIQSNLIRERGTRYAIQQVLFDLTGRAPLIIEPARPADVGGLGISIGLGVGGAVGSISTPYQAFVTAYRQTGVGASGWPGLATYSFGLGSAGMIDSSAMSPAVSDADIIAAIESVRPAATAIWLRISN
ncbi:hypothetical protein [Paludibacterium yongneupense]|uniref:hypothetical protein n=1 Tax=Paludibacterium yongneupense TaxID=400061 RepID=UPI00049219A2|nr:hypothetical protein [Paludibacterium yongneupense]